MASFLLGSSSTGPPTGVTSMFLLRASSLPQPGSTSRCFEAKATARGIVAPIELEISLLMGLIRTWEVHRLALELPCPS